MSGSEFQATNPPAKIADTGSTGEQGERPELASAIQRLREWYVTQLNQEAEKPVECQPSIDIATLLGLFLSLRQEINLQTRAVRAQQEQTSEVVRQIQHALEQLQSSHREECPDEQRRSVLLAMIEAHDALSLAGREIERSQEKLLQQIESLVLPEFDDSQESVTVTRPKSFWSRWFGKSEPADQRVELLCDRLRRQSDLLARVRPVITSLLTGYRMSQERIEQLFRRQGLEAIPTEGKVFDPERMEVLEAVSGSGLPNGQIVEEVRRGYVWNGRVFRCALVRVARD